MQARLEDVDDRLELHVVGREHGDLGRLEPHLVLRSLEVVARLARAPRLVEGERAVRRVDLARDVKRTSNSARRTPRPARKLPAGHARASGASTTLTWFSAGV